MKQKDIYAYVASRSGLSQAKSKLAIKAFVGYITKNIFNGVIVQDLGKFSVTHRSKRNGINPKTGEKIIVPPCDSPRFSAGIVLKRSVKSWDEK